MGNGWVSDLLFCFINVLDLSPQGKNIGCMYTLINHAALA